MTHKGASFRQRRVSAELRALRVARGLSCAEVAQAIGVSESKISRMETGKRGLQAFDVATILGFLQAPLKLREELMALVSAGEGRNWHTIHGKLPGHWRDLIEFEGQASALYNYETLLVPGLAQTSDYARAIMRGSAVRLSEAEVDALVATRLGRQAVIGKAQVHLIIDEAVLHRPLGDPQMMRAQLHHLVALANRARTQVRVVPLDSPTHTGLDGPFMRLEFPDQPSLIYVETRFTSSFLEEEEHLLSAKLAWRQLCSLALAPEESVALIAKHAGKLT
ncbi:helix-turn-helix domain-containing protein [Actinosynnema sp.]|uniref:helix-turn-helix domain-containing protein n=1 Tax=Actinosynnema sp. TaxID=1872144 RepID=UPI003F86B270